MNVDSGHRAVRALLVASDADEVRVDDPGRVLRVMDDEAALAQAAEERALEVMVVYASLLPGQARREHCLTLLPRGLIDERRVPSRVARVLEGDDAQVVRVVEDLVELARCQRTGGPLGRWRTCESACGQLVEELVDGVLAGCEGFECPGDLRCPGVVEYDGPNLTALVVHSSAVAVADGGSPRRAAGLRFLTHALDDLVSEIARVELSDGAHDAVQQHAGGSFVDVLAYRDESGIRLLDGEVDGHVVCSAARQAVDFVHDDEVDRGLGNELQHALQVGAVGGAS